MSLIEATTGQITSRAEDGRVTVEHLDLPQEVSNGLPPKLLLNILPSISERKVSYVAPGSKPRLVHLTTKPIGSLSFWIGGMRRTATDFTVHVELGGITSLVSPLIDREQKDTIFGFSRGSARLHSRGRAAL